MALLRGLKHLAMPRAIARLKFPQSSLDAIEAAIRNSEMRHRGEIRFAVEASLDLRDLAGGARRRAENLFASLRVWDTEDNSGVLIYVQLADRRVEIVADRGITARVPQPAWDAICRRLEDAYRQRRFEAGTVAAIGEITELLVSHFPASETNPNELPDAPLVL